MSYPFSPDPQNKGLNPDESPGSQCRGSAVGAGAAAPLDRVTKSVRQIRIARYRHQRGAAALLGHKHRVGLCQWAMISRHDGVGLDLIDYPDRQRAAFTGVQRCGSVWLCPCCSARISEIRRGELNALLSWARSRDLRPVMVTLTARHGRDDDLGDLFERLKKAKQRLHRHRTWTGMKRLIAGSVTATEVTHGRNGWHPHLHMILLISAEDEGGAVMIANDLLRPWLASLHGAGLDGTGAGFRAQGAAAAGAYVGKWGAAEELALQGQKVGRGGGRTPAQLLAAAVDDHDDEAGALWQRFAAVFQGRRQLVWSRGLKRAAGIEDTSDEDAAAEGAKPVRREICRIDPADWRGDVGRKGARHRRGLVLDAAEDAGASGVAAVVAAGGEDPRPDPDPGPLIEAEGRANLFGKQGAQGGETPGDDIIPPPLYKGGIMWPEGGVEHSHIRTGGDTSVDPTPNEVRPRSARQWWPGDETKRGRMIRHPLRRGTADEDSDDARDTRSDTRSPQSACSEVGAGAGWGCGRGQGGAVRSGEVCPLAGGADEPDRTRACR